MFKITPKDVSRFWSKVEIGKPNQCWNWKDSTNPVSTRGYGAFRISSLKNKIKPHRFSYLLANKFIPKDMCVLHTCDNPACVNPSHLFIGTSTDNAIDRHKKGRTSCVSRNVGSKHGHAKLTEKQVIQIRLNWGKGETQRSLEKKHNLKRGTLWPVVHNINWKHVS